MDAADWSVISLRARAAREFKVSLEPACIHLLTPTLHETEMAAMESDMPGKPKAAMVAFKRLMLCRAIVGWDGVTQAHLLTDGATEPVTFDAVAVPLLLDSQPEWARKLWDALLEKMEQRSAASQAATKNS